MVGRNGQAYREDHQSPFSITLKHAMSGGAWKQLVLRNFRRRKTNPKSKPKLGLSKESVLLLN